MRDFEVSQLRRGPWQTDRTPLSVAGLIRDRELYPQDYMPDDPEADGSATFQGSSTRLRHDTIAPRQETRKSPD